jgi:hypothetical protein
VACAKADAAPTANAKAVMMRRVTRLLRFRDEGIAALLAGRLLGAREGAIQSIAMQRVKEIRQPL